MFYVGDVYYIIFSDSSCRMNMTMMIDSIKEDKYEIELTNQFMCINILKKDLVYNESDDSFYTSNLIISHLS